MRSKKPNPAIDGEWREGFLFVGNRLILDFINTLPVIDGQPTELLPDASALARWLVAAGLSDHSLVDRWKAVQSNSFSKEINALHEFREVARSELFKLEHGSDVSPAFVVCVNEHLKNHPLVAHLSLQDGTLSKGTLFEPKRPGDVFGPLAEDIAQLLTDHHPQRLRKCSSCAVHFLDTSKKGTRRWCSMALCGNRSKVAAYARRIKNKSDAGWLSATQGT
jgi:predicted RNA-binding Zn ribbon-like protein